VTAAIEYRSWTPDGEGWAPDLEVRSDGDGRTVSGIAVPYNVEQRIHDGLTEVFVPGAFRAQMKAAHRVLFARNHLAHGGDLIGRLTEMRDDAKGLYIEARISATTVGEETLTLLKDGVLEEMSIGFAERQNRPRPNGTIERRTAHLAEVAVVLEGAYGRAARVAKVRSAGDCCPTCGVAAAPAPRSGLLKARAVLEELPVLSTR
jgi:uncharacterized protein